MRRFADSPKAAKEAYMIFYDQDHLRQSMNKQKDVRGRTQDQDQQQVPRAEPEPEPLSHGQEQLVGMGALANSAKSHWP